MCQLYLHSHLKISLRIKETRETLRVLPRKRAYGPSSWSTVEFVGKFRSSSRDISSPRRLRPGLANLVGKQSRITLRDLSWFPDSCNDYTGQLRVSTLYILLVSRSCAPSTVARLCRSLAGGAGPCDPSVSALHFPPPSRRRG